MIFKICSEVLPESGNSLSRSELFKIAVAFVDNFIQSYSEEQVVIIREPDDTKSNTYGAQ